MLKEKFYLSAIEIFNFGSDFLFDIHDLYIFGRNTSIYAEETEEYVKIEFDASFDFTMIYKISSIMDLAKNLFPQDKKLYFYFGNKSMVNVFGSSSQKKSENYFYKNMVLDVFPSSKYNVKKENAVSISNDEKTISFFSVSPKKIKNIPSMCDSNKTKKLFLNICSDQFLPIKAISDGSYYLEIGNLKVRFSFYENGIVKFIVMDTFERLLILKNGYFNVFSEDFNFMKFLKNFSISEKSGSVFEEFRYMFECLLNVGVSTYKGDYLYENILNGYPLSGHNVRYKNFSIPHLRAGHMSISDFISNLIDSKDLEEIRNFCEMVIYKKTSSAPAYLNIQLEQIIDANSYFVKHNLPSDTILFIYSLINKNGVKKNFYISMNSFATDCGILPRFDI